MLLIGMFGQASCNILHSCCPLAAHRIHLKAMREVGTNNIELTQAVPEHQPSARLHCKCYQGAGRTTAAHAVGSPLTPCVHFVREISSQRRKQTLKKLWTWLLMVMGLRSSIFTENMNKSLSIKSANIKLVEDLLSTVRAVRALCCSNNQRKAMMLRKLTFNDLGIAAGTAQSAVLTQTSPLSEIHSVLVCIFPRLSTTANTAQSFCESTADVAAMKVVGSFTSCEQSV